MCIGNAATSGMASGVAYGRTTFITSTPFITSDKVSSYDQPSALGSIVGSLEAK